MNKGTKRLFCGFVGDPKLASYVGIIINHYKDPYEKTQYLMESTDVFVLVALMPGFFRGLDICYQTSFPFSNIGFLKPQKRHP